MPSWGHLGTQDFSGLNFFNINIFHENIMLLLLFLVIFSFLGLVSIWTSTYCNNFLVHNENMETLYTFFPILLLVVLGYYSLGLLSMTEDYLEGEDLSFKTIGHQWYWSYEYSDFSNLSYDSYMLDNNLNDFHLLNTDFHLVIPYDSVIRNSVTSVDVIHSWTIPSLGMKLDAFPGRLNMMYFIIKFPGLYFGQCSEICGVNHAFMPICLESIPLTKFMNWVKSFN